MGQYYKVLTKDENGEVSIYNRNVDGEYTLAKLMEHSWWKNEFVSTICKKIYKNPKKIFWVGDYSREEGPYNDLSQASIEKIYDLVWENDGQDVKKDELFLNDKYLVNHTDKIYINCNDYYNKCRFDDVWCIHPLPLLTALGNGLGGGDYRGINMSDIGSWVNCWISVEDDIPSNYCLEEYEFVEQLKIIKNNKK